MPQLLFIDSNHPVLLSTLREKGFTCDEDYMSSKAEIEKKISVYDGIVIRSRFKIDRVFMDAAKKLKCIARAGAGMENIDVAYAESKGIRCVSAPEGNRDAVGEHALGMLLSLMNNLCRADREVREGKWNRESNRGYELAGKTVGVIGYGNMGSAFVQRLRGFDVRVLVYDKYKKNFGDEWMQEVALEKIFEEADVLSLHIPLTEETRNMVNEKFLAQFRKKIWLVNTARGQVLDTAALVNALQNETVRGACLDVLEYESLSFEKLDASKLPESFRFLIASDRVMLSPHIAGWTMESNEKIARALAGKIITVFG